MQGQLVGLGRPQAHRELLVTAPQNRVGERDRRRRPPVRSRARPVAAPRVVGDEVLELAREVGRGARGPVASLVTLTGDTDPAELPPLDWARRSRLTHREDRLGKGLPQAHLDRAVRPLESDVDEPL